jgi:hypothetical protein
MSSAIHWWGNVSVTGRNEVPTLEDFVLDGRYLHWEKKNLIEAFERWLETWNSEFGYHDRQASKMRWPKP